MIVHYCLPGLQDIWAVYLMQIIRKHMWQRWIWFKYFFPNSQDIIELSFLMLIVSILHKLFDTCFMLCFEELFNRYICIKSVRPTNKKLGFVDNIHMNWSEIIVRELRLVRIEERKSGFILLTYLLKNMQIWMQLYNQDNVLPAEYVTLKKVFIDSSWMKLDIGRQLSTTCCNFKPV